MELASPQMPITMVQARRSTTAAMSVRGFLRKKGAKRHNWKRRWFEVDGTSLRYFRDIDKAELGIVWLADVLAVEETPSRPRCTTLILIGRNFLIEAPSDPEHAAWLEALRHNVKRLDTAGHLFVIEGPWLRSVQQSMQVFHMLLASLHGRAVLRQNATEGTSYYSVTWTPVVRLYTKACVCEFANHVEVAKPWLQHVQHNYFELRSSALEPIPPLRRRTVLLVNGSQMTVFLSSFHIRMYASPSSPEPSIQLPLARVTMCTTSALGTLSIACNDTQTTYTLAPVERSTDGIPLLHWFAWMCFNKSVIKCTRIPENPIPSYRGEVIFSGAKLWMEADEDGIAVATDFRIQAPRVWIRGSRVEEVTHGAGWVSVVGGVEGTNLVLRAASASKEHMLVIERATSVALACLAWVKEMDPSFYVTTTSAYSPQSSPRASLNRASSLGDSFSASLELIALRARREGLTDSRPPLSPVPEGKGGSRDLTDSSNGGTPPNGEDSWGQTTGTMDVEAVPSTMAGEPPIFDGGDVGDGAAGPAPTSSTEMMSGRCSPSTANTATATAITTTSTSTTTATSDTTNDATTVTPHKASPCSAPHPSPPSPALSMDQSGGRPRHSRTVSKGDDSVPVLDRIALLQPGADPAPVGAAASSPGPRKSYNEDAYVLVDEVLLAAPEDANSDSAGVDDDDLWDNEELSVYGVWDGHGGSEAAKMAAATCESQLGAAIAAVGTAVDPVAAAKEVMQHMIAASERQIVSQAVASKWECGSTAVVLLVQGRVLCCGNLGDSECVVATRSPDGGGYVAQALSRKHTPNDPQETQRIEAAGASVIRDRLMGRLAVSRSLGDIPWKSPWNGCAEHWVSAEPHVCAIQLTPDVHFAILASDGLWESVRHQEAVDMVADMLVHDAILPAEVMCERLVGTAIGRGCTDNVTVALVFFWDILD